MNRVLILVMSVFGLLASGCSTSPSAPQIIETKIRVNVPCDPGLVPAPEFPVDSLTGDEDIYDKAKTLAADIETREGYEARLNAAINSCRP